MNSTPIWIRLCIE
ncbi:hypothetical protein CGLO_17493 [Colletotrichum gloeosporioides Cg-14]|uniref:Uncharacterized protein n=1 Tax=Colletotrichum gloeosporioides (strain Cg-14) TaxID=1237896 RepID=T0JKW5_COLGC|nr:hypothetical protein CGLO_17493 [Colletotrichum gloeosporioides Cg-14]